MMRTRLTITATVLFAVGQIIHFCAPAIAQQTKSQLQTTINGIATGGGNTAAAMRNVLDQMLDSSPMGTDVAAGVDQNILNSVSTTYSIQSSDCGKTVLATQDTLYTVTLPSVSGFPPVCTVIVKNASAARAKGLSGFPSDFTTGFLWPQQAIGVKIISGAWATTINPGRWRVPSGGAIFNIDNTSGSNANDGLATGTGNALASIAAFNAIVTNDLDTNNQIVTALFTNGQTNSNIVLNATITGGGTINLHGNGSTANTTTTTAAINIYVAPNNGVYANVGAAVQDFTVTCSGGGHGLEVLLGYVQLYQNMTFGTCTGGGQIVVDSMLARIIIGANYSITGSAAYHLLAIAGLIDWNSGSFTATLTGTPNFTGAFAFSEIGANLVSIINWSGSATGVRYTASAGGQIYTAGAGGTYFPGNSGGSTSGGGLYN